jgi:transposase
MNVKRAYRYRFYPTPEQADLLARTFGCTRFVYNVLLRRRTDAWHQRQERLGYHDTSAVLTALKKDPDHRWLNDASCVPLQQALRHLKTAFSNFFSGRAKRCAVCGFTLARVSLQVRAWCCPDCGTTHDRDVNAARNVLAAGLAVSALGESVNPACI